MKKAIAPVAMALLILAGATFLWAETGAPVTEEKRSPREERGAASKGKPLNVLLYFGLYTQWYGIEKALEGMGKHELRISNARTDGADFFPTGEEELSDLDVIVLSDVNYNSIGDFGIRIIDAFVKGGGGLLVLGGPFAYGEGDYEKTDLAEILPVTGIGPFDLKWEKKGVPITSRGKHPILDGVDFSAKPYIFWIHQARLKPGSLAILKAGNRPLLVLGKYGNGRVAAFLGTPLGVAPEGKTPFWEWDGWQRLVQNSLRWLSEGKRVRKVAEGPTREVLVFSEDFEKAPPGANPARLGWHVSAPKGAVFEITPEHHLKILHTTVDYCGDRISHPVKPIRRGALEFDVKLGSESSDWFSLKVMVAGKNTAFTGGNWRVYESKPTPTKIQWRKVGTVPLDEWHRVRVEFDLEARFPILKFFVDGKQTGSAGAEEGVKEFKEVIFADYGLSSGRVTNYVDNIKVFEKVRAKKAKD